MALAFEIVFAVGLAVVGLSFAGVVFGRLSREALVIVTVALGAAAAATAIGFGIVLLVEDFGEAEPILLATGGLAAAALAEGGLIALRSMLRSAAEADGFISQAMERLDRFLADHAEERSAHLERILATERATAGHLLAEQERKLSAERRGAVAQQSEEAETELSEAVTAAQHRLEQRLESWIADLERGQRARESKLAELSKRQSDALSAYDTRLEANSELLAAATEEQREELLKLRQDLERIAKEFSAGAQTELEVHEAERRRAFQELDERMRQTEKGLREQIEREESDAVARLSGGLAEAERRQLEKFSRAIDRASTRYVEEAERRFDEQIRQSRENSAERLARELEKAMDEFTRRAETEVADRIAEVAQSTVDRLQRRVADIARAAEAQHEDSAQRLRLLSERLQEALTEAEERARSFERQIETTSQRP